MANKTEQVVRLLGIAGGPGVIGPSPYSVPDGSMLSGSLNVVLRNQDTIEARYGLERMLRALPYDKLIEYSGRVITHRASDGKLSLLATDLASIAVTDLGFATNPASGVLKVQSAVAGGRLFITSAAGLQVLDSVSATVRAAGGPLATSIDASRDGGLFAGTTLANNKRVAYRFTMGRVTSEGLQIIGAPSGRIVVQNTTGAAADVDLYGYFDSGLDESYFFQVWRSSQVDLGIEPEDDLRLVYERQLTAGEVAYKGWNLLDITPDSLRGEFLYTSPNAGEGIQNANTPPPIAEHVVTHKNRLWLGATTTRQSIDLQLLAVGGTNGLANNDRLIITGPASPLVLTAGTTFLVITSGSASFNVEQTARSIVDALNHDFTGTLLNTDVWAEYMSGPDDAPGAIRIYTRAANGNQFTLWTDMQSASAAWTHREAITPQLPPLILGSDGTRTFSLQRVANVVTATVAAGNIAGMLQPGEKIQIFNPAGSFAAGPHVVTGVTGTTFTYAEVGVNAGPTAGFTVIWIGEPIVSTSESIPNRVYFSKPYEYEAFPGGNYTDIGASDKAIVAMRVTRETLWVFKEDGLYRITGDDEDTFDVERVDATIVALATEAVVNFNEAIVAWTTKGVIQVSESTFDVLSEPISELLKRYLLAAAELYLPQAFIVADSRTGLIRLHLGGGSQDDTAAVVGAGDALVYSVDTQSWSRWAWPYAAVANANKPLTHGLVLSSSHRTIYANAALASVGEGFVMREKAPNTGAVGLYQDDDETIPSAVRLSFTQRALWAFNYGKAPLLDKRFDEVAFLFVEPPGTVLTQALTYAISTSLNAGGDTLAGLVSLTTLSATYAAIASNGQRVIRCTPPNDIQRGQRLYFGIELPKATANGSTAIQMHGFSVLLEVLTGSISR